MPEQFVQSHIKRLPLFERLPDDQLERLAAIVQVLRFEPGALVFVEGQPSQGLFLFVAGRGVLTRFSPHPVNPAAPPVEEQVGEVTANEYVGETSLFMETMETTSLHVVESAVVLFVPRQALASLLVSQPEMRLNLGLGRAEGQPLVRPLFRGQRSDETVLRIFRRHWWSYARFAWIPLLIATALIVGALMLAGSLILAVGMFGLALIIPAIIMLYVYIEWQDDAIVITDQRVVRIYTRLLKLENTLSEIPLDRVIEVSIYVPPGDPFARLFTYGTVNVKAATPSEPITLGMIPKPEALREMVFAHRDQFRERIARDKRRIVQAEVDKLLGVDSGTVAGEPVSLSDIIPAPQHTGFSFAPLRMRFVNEQGNLVFRKHYSVWLRHVIAPSLLIVVCAVLMIVNIIRPIPDVGIVGAIIPFFFILLGFIWFYFADWDWRNDQFILSDEIITLIRKRPFWLQNEIDQVRLSQVDSVVSEVHGLLDNLLSRGNVRISLIGADDKIMESVHRPQDVQAEISQRLSKRTEIAQRAEAERQRDAITDYLSAYHERLAQAQAGSDDLAQVTRSMSAAGDASPVSTTAPSEPPPQPIRDAIRPPRVPRTRPDDLPP